MSNLSKYGVARHIYKPMIKRAVVDFAVGADWTPAAGDVKISKDGGAAANVTNLPVAIVMGNTAYWDFSLTATEMQAAQVIVTVGDSATKAVEDQLLEIETYGNTNAQHAVDLDDNVRAGLTAMRPDAFLAGTVDNTVFAPTATQFETSSITTAQASAYVGLSVYASSGSAAAQLLGVVTAYTLVGGRGHFTLSGPASGQAMANGNSFYLA